MELTKDKAEEIFSEYSSYVFRMAYFMTKSTASAEDIVQDTFLRVFQKFDTFDAAKELKPWIYQIALNCVRKQMRKQNRMKLWPWKAEAAKESAEDFVMENEEKQEIWTEVDKLDRKYKEMVFMRYYLQLTLPEISEMLGIPLGTCKSRLFHALQKLRVALPEHTVPYFARKAEGSPYETK